VGGEVGERGIALTRIDDVSAAPWDRLMTELERTLDDPRSGVCLRDGEYYRVDSTEALLARPPQYLYLSDDLLTRESALPAAVTAAEIVAPLETMLGCHVRLVNLMVYRNFAGGGKDAGSMKWHYDNQPVHCYKLIVYLSEVPEGGGEFQYLVGSPRDIHPVPGFGESRLSDPLVVQRYPVLRCTGGRGDALYFNANGYHRGGNVARGRRTVLCAHYKPSKVPAPEHLARFGFGGVGTAEYGPDPGRVWWQPAAVSR